MDNWKISLDGWLTQTPEEYYGTEGEDKCYFNCAECGCCDIKVAELNAIEYEKFISHVKNLGAIT